MPIINYDPSRSSEALEKAGQALLKEIFQPKKEDLLQTRKELEDKIKSLEDEIYLIRLRLSSIDIKIMKVMGISKI